MGQQGVGGVHGGQLDALDQVFATVFDAQDALVRHNFVSGTHALTVALFGLLRPGDTMLCVTGRPYDTLLGVIGVDGRQGTLNKGSLQDFGICYREIPLDKDGHVQLQAIKEAMDSHIKMVYIQRSRGYDLRPSLLTEEIAQIAHTAKAVVPECIVMLDNCYGEFVQEKEPIEVGADLAIGSLIKNLGGGIAPNGAYIVGRADLIELASERLTAPGLGKEAGASLGINKQFLQGIFFAPQVVASSIKTAIFASKILEELGYKVDPRYNEKRADIVQTIQFGEPEKLIKFCQGIQAASPVDSSSIPEPWDMPGYTDKIIMAAGAFTQGSSIELSCDAPIRAPYTAFLQGGLTYEYGKLGILKAISMI